MSARNFKFADKSNWSLINRGQIFEAVVPYVGERPLEFFIPDRTNPHTGSLRRGMVVAYNSEFNQQESFDVVLGLKTRKVVIVTNDELNQDVTHDDINIAKIYSVKEHDKEDEWYNVALNGMHPFFVYLCEFSN